MTEAELQAKVADYLRIRYPGVLFHSDFGSGIKLTKGQAVKQKRQNGGRRGWPDMFIAEPMGYYRDRMDEVLHINSYYNGLFLELKKEGTRIKKKDGNWATDHIAEQAEILQALQDRGYKAYFAVGFDEAVDIIDDYLGG